VKYARCRKTFECKDAGRYLKDALSKESKIEDETALISSAIETS
jgi:hypothetical protein